MLQDVELIGIVEEEANAVSEQVDRGLEPGGQNQPRGRPQFVVGQSDALVGGHDQFAHQIVARVATQFIEVVGQPCVEAIQAVLDTHELIPGQSDVKAGSCLFPEFQHALTFVVGDAQNGADHGDRELRAVLVDNVDFARAGTHLVQEAVCLSLHHLAHPGNRSWGEHRGDQFAVPGVLGWFDCQQRRRFERVKRRRAGPSLGPSQRSRQIGAELGNPEVV